MLLALRDYEIITRTAFSTNSTESKLFFPHFRVKNLPYSDRIKAENKTMLPPLTNQSTSKLIYNSIEIQ